MSRTRLAIVAVIGLAAVGTGLGLLLGTRHSDPPLAHVNGETITSDQLDVAVDHFRKQAEEENEPFPDDKSARFRSLRNRLLGVLVYRLELAQAAARLGVGVSNVQVLRRMNTNSEGEEHNTDQFTYDTVKAQMLYERIYAEVTRSIRARTTVELTARRNAAMQRYTDRLKRNAQVRYEPGYAPGP